VTSNQKFSQQDLESQMHADFQNQLKKYSELEILSSKISLETENIILNSPTFFTVIGAAAPKDIDLQNKSLFKQTIRSLVKVGNDNLDFVLNENENISFISYINTTDNTIHTTNIYPHYLSEENNKTKICGVYGEFWIESRTNIWARVWMETQYGREFYGHVFTHVDEGEWVYTSGADYYYIYK
jgi:hypothetical protein